MFRNLATLGLERVTLSLISATLGVKFARELSNVSPRLRFRIDQHARRLCNLLMLSSQSLILLCLLLQALLSVARLAAHRRSL